MFGGHSWSLEYAIHHLTEDEHQTGSSLVGAHGVEFAVCHVAIPSLAVDILQTGLQIFQLVLEQP